MPRTRKRRFAMALATGAAALAVAPAAHAATAEVKSGAVIYDVDIQNPFAQKLQVDFKNGRFVFTETGAELRVGLNAKSGCSKGDGKVISCASSGVNRMVIETQLFDDAVTISDAVNVPVTFSMGPGDDQANGSVLADTFAGGLSVGLGDDTFAGKGGDDRFVAGPNADLMKGGAGIDTLDYSARALRQSVTLGDNEFNDGDPTDLAGLSSASLSGADKAVEIENVIGGTAKDTLAGSDDANTIDGGKGPDTIEGRGGPDTLIGGDGDDTILARSPATGVADPDARITCGGGLDKVVVDREDDPAIDPDCEDIDCARCEQPPDGSPPTTPSPAPNIAAIDPPGGANDADEGPGPGGGGPPPDPDGAGPEPAPPALPPEVEIVSDGVVPLAANGRIGVRIVCIYRAERCEGSLTLKTASTIKAKVGRKVRKIAKGTTIATADLAPIRWGNSEPVQLKASALFRAILARLKKPRTKVQVDLVSRDSAGGADAPEAEASGTLTVSAKPARKRR
jgi:hypothetical protein